MQELVGGVVFLIGENRLKFLQIVLFEVPPIPSLLKTMPLPLVWPQFISDIFERHFTITHTIYLENCISLQVTNYGKRGLQNGRSGASEVLPLQKGVAEKVVAILKGG